jgi:hypothetical protein
MRNWRNTCRACRPIATATACENGESDRMISISRMGASWAALATLGFACALPAAAQAQKEGGAIFTCTAASGRRLTSDRPIAECMDREQRVLNKDGSLRMIMPPSLTADERAAAEDAEKKKVAEAAAKKDAIRRDRNLLARYPNEAAHKAARDKALDDTRGAIEASEKRLAELQRDRKPLEGEAEFYKGKPLPAKLKRDMDAIDVALEAQRSTVSNQRIELGRINALYDAELAYLKKLWAGAEPGSLGPLPQAGAPAASVPALATTTKPAAPKKP